MPALTFQRLQHLLLQIGFAHSNDDDDRYELDERKRPAFRCCWLPTPDGAALEWDGCETFHTYAESLRYMMGTFFLPWGHTLEGDVRWEREDGATGTLKAHGHLVSDEPDALEE